MGGVDPYLIDTPTNCAVSIKNLVEHLGLRDHFIDLDDGSQVHILEKGSSWKDLRPVPTQGGPSTISGLGGRSRGHLAVWA